MDRQKVKDHKKKYQIQKAVESEITEEIASLPNPRYYSIILNLDQIELIESLISEGADITDIQDLLYRFTGNSYKFNDGDIIGIYSTADIQKLPDIFLRVDNANLGYEPISNRKYDQDRFRDLGYYTLPGYLEDANRDEIEAIYQFPFLKGKKKKL